MQTLGLNGIKFPKTLGEYEPYRRELDELGNLHSLLVEKEHAAEEKRANATEAEIQSIEADCELLRRAIEKQCGKVSQEKQAASRAVCEARRAEYRSMQRRKFHALVNLGRAVEQQKEFHRQLDDSDVSFSAYLPVIPFRDFDVNDSCGSLAAWMREAEAEGIITHDDIPREWLKAWGW